MRRADRLFQIVQFLRSRRLTTAEWLAATLEVSKRTIYRDVEELILCGVPIEGEAGVGYVLRRKLDLPPLMFERTELAAIELGLRFVSAYTERPLTQAAASAMSKIRSAVPGANGRGAAAPLYAPRKSGFVAASFGSVFAAIDAKRKLEIRYESERAEITRRVVWPLGVFFHGNAWTALGWCELRQNFRSFRIDRIKQLDVLTDVYPDTPGRRLADYFRLMEKTHNVRPLRHGPARVTPFENQKNVARMERRGIRATKSFPHLTMCRGAARWIKKPFKRPAPKAAATLGIAIQHVAPEQGAIEVTFEGKPQFTNPAGNIQGGFLAAMLDDTMAPALAATLARGEFAPTLNLNVSFARPAKVGRIEDKGRILKRGKEVCFLAGELYQDGEFVASATAIVRRL